MKKFMIFIVILFFIACSGSECDTTDGNTQDVQRNLAAGAKMAQAQPVPTDVDYSLERWNLIRRMYWVNGQREKARNLPCPIKNPPLGYCILFFPNGAVAGRFVVEGKVSSLKNYLTPISEYYQTSSSYSSKWIPSEDGTYGDNPEGIFFFTPDKRYMEWTGIILYSDTLFEISDPILKIGGK